MTSMEMWVTIASSVATIGALTYILNSQIGGLRREMDAHFDAVEARFSGVDARFTGVEGRFIGIDHRLDTLGSDMTLIKAHLLNVKA